jgi:cyclase
MSKRAAVTVSGLSLLLAAAAVAQSPAQAPVSAVIETQPLRSGLHLLRGAGCNVVVWNGPDGVLVVDSGNAAAAPQLLEAIGRVTDGSVRFLVNTHWHPDHVGGNAALRRTGALAIAHQQTRALMSERQAVPAYDLDVPAAPRDALPSVTFDDTLDAAPERRSPDAAARAGRA